MFNTSSVEFKVGRDGYYRIVLKPLSFYSLLVNKKITVPSGFKTDLGSIPMLLQGIIPKDGRALFGYVIHDYLYATKSFNRRVCDEILDECMVELKVNWLQRKAIMAGLFIGGLYAYNNK